MICPITGFDCITCDGICDLEEKRMRALYEGEKRAGLLDDPEKIRQDIIYAGRGHLVPRK